MVLVGLYGTESPLRMAFYKGFPVLVVSHDTVKWWRRRELNPRPQILHLKATTCLVSRLFNPIAAN